MDDSDSSHEPSRRARFLFRGFNVTRERIEIVSSAWLSSRVLVAALASPTDIVPGQPCQCTHAGARRREPMALYFRLRLWTSPARARGNVMRREGPRKARSEVKTPKTARSRRRRRSSGPWRDSVGWRQRGAGCCAPRRAARGRHPLAAGSNEASIRQRGLAVLVWSGTRRVEVDVSRTITLCDGEDGQTGG